MRTETPGRLSSLGLLIASLVIGGLGLALAPWADSFFHSTHRLLASEGERTAGEFAWEVSSALLVCGVAGVGWAIRDLIVGPTKR